MIGIGDIREARGRIHDKVHRTPLVRSTMLSRRTGGTAYLKLENMQKTGSFKPRGALNNILALSPQRRDKGLITISAGNHAQGVAYAAAQVGAHAIVVMPAGASASKAEATRGYGAEVVLHGDVEAAFEKVEELRKEKDLTFIHPFDDDATIAGQGTVGQEIVEDLPGVATVVAGIGGGGLISGVALAVKSLAPRARVVGVEPTGAAAMHLSRRNGSPVRLEAIDTIADGLAPPFVGERNFEVVQACVDELVLVDDDEIRAAMRFLLERCKVLAEPAGAAATAAVLSGKIPETAGDTVVIVSGGNISMESLAGCLRG
ncbi:MAG: threonine/serine dehydratase [Acidobacteriota bacterium]